jgi:hypothetical protein
MTPEASNLAHTKVSPIDALRALADLGAEVARASEPEMLL